MSRPFKFLWVFGFFVTSAFAADERTFWFCPIKDLPQSDVDGPSKSFSGNLGPYLQSVTSRSAILEWHTEKALEGNIYIIDDPERIGRILPPSKHQIVALCKLEPGRTYKYQINKTFKGSFRTLPEKPPLHFIATGDLGRKTPGKPKIRALMEKQDPDLILWTGDLAYNRGTYNSFKNYVFDYYQFLLSSRAIYPVAGNHDTRYRSGKAYLDLFTLPFNNEEKTEKYYSFRAAHAEFFMLNTDFDSSLKSANSKQVLWLEQGLKTSKANWKFVVLHHPIFSSKGSHGENKSLIQTIHPLLSRYGVDMVFSGHEHFYERTNPIDGVTYIVTGGGGRKLREARNIAPYSAKYHKAFHITDIVLNENDLILRAIDENGVVFDEWHKEKTNTPLSKPPEKNKESEGNLTNHGKLSLDRKAVALP